MKLRLSPTLFLILEFFILLPSLLFIAGVLEWYINGTGQLLYVIGIQDIVRGVIVTVLTPFAGGFLAYNYLERYGPKGYIRKITKLILGYAIIEIGLVITIFILSLLSR